MDHFGGDERGGDAGGVEGGEEGDGPDGGEGSGEAYFMGPYLDVLPQAVRAGSENVTQ